MPKIEKEKPLMPILLPRNLDRRLDRIAPKLAQGNKRARHRWIWMAEEFLKLNKNKKH